MKTTSEGQNDQTNHAGRGASDMTDENTAANQPGWPLTATRWKELLWDGKSFTLSSVEHDQHFFDTSTIGEPELPINSKLDDELRKFEFKRRFEKIQFQVREEFKSEAAKIALELQRSEPLANALSKPGPCDGTMYSKIMPWRQS